MSLHGPLSMENCVSSVKHQTDTLVNLKAPRKTEESNLDTLIQ